MIKNEKLYRIIDEIELRELTFKIEAVKESLDKNANHTDAQKDKELMHEWALDAEVLLNKLIGKLDEITPYIDVDKYLEDTFIDILG